MRRSTLVLLTVSVAVPVLGGCVYDDGRSGGAADPPVTVSASAAVPNTSTKGSSQDPDVVISVRISSGVVNPSALPVYATVGQSVELTGVSDVSETLHVKGYERTVQLAPGAPARLTFTVGRKGTFEVESHATGRLVATLVVSDRH